MNRFNVGKLMMWIAMLAIVIATIIFGFLFARAIMEDSMASFLVALWILLGTLFGSLLLYGFGRIINDVFEIKEHFLNGEIVHDDAPKLEESMLEIRSGEAYPKDMIQAVWDTTVLKYVDNCEVCGKTNVMIKKISYFKDQENVKVCKKCSRSN